MRRKQKQYRIYGRAPHTKTKARYLFSTSAYNKGDARRFARNRVKGAYTITKVVKSK